MGKRIKRKSTPRLVMDALMAAALILLILGVNLSSASRQFESLHWPSVRGVITQDEIKKNGRRTGVRFECSYVVGDRAYSISKPTLVKMSVQSWLYHAAFDGGSEVAVWYDPAHPEVATLRRGLGFADVIFPLAIIGVSCWFVCLAVIELIGRAYGRQRDLGQAGDDGYTGVA